MNARALFLASFMQVLAVGPANTALRDAAPPQIAEFYLKKTSAGDVYMAAPLTKRQEWNLSVDRGTFYFSCSRGSVNDFRFNSHIITNLVDYIDGNKNIFIGLSKVRNNGYLPIASKQTNIVDKVPDDLEIDTWTRAFSTSVRGYSPFSVEDDDSLYISTYVDAEFAQSFFESDRISLIAYANESGRFEIIYHARYTVSPETRTGFLRECAQQ